MSSLSLYLCQCHHFHACPQVSRSPPKAGSRPDNEKAPRWGWSTSFVQLPPTSSSLPPTPPSRHQPLRKWLSLEGGVLHPRKGMVRVVPRKGGGGGGTSHCHLELDAAICLLLHGFFSGQSRKSLKCDLKQGREFHGTDRRALFLLYCHKQADWVTSLDTKAPKRMEVQE